MSRAAIVAPNGDILLPCSVCERILPIDEFSPNRSKQAGPRLNRAYKCRRCVSVYWREKRLERAAASGRAFRPLTVNPDPRKRHCAGCKQYLPVEVFRPVTRTRRLADGTTRISQERLSRCPSCLSEQRAKDRRKRQLRLASDPQLAAEQATLDRRSRQKTRRHSRQEARERTRWVCRQARALLALVEEHGWPHAGFQRATGMSFSTLQNLANPDRERELLAAIGTCPQAIVKRSSERKLLQFRARLGANDPELLAALKQRPSRSGREIESSVAKDQRTP